MSLLDVHQLHITLPSIQGAAEAVRGVSLLMQAGDRLGLIGESGCGKSLTALALMGLLPPGAHVAGQIRFDDQELIGASETLLCDLRGRRIAMVFQEPMTALNPLQTIGAQVGEPLRQHQGLSRRAARARALELLQQVRLPQAAERLDAYPHQLSGGQRQRVMIAAALACGPALLIADEPTTALDASVQQELLDLLRELTSDGRMALLLISHDLAVMSQTVTRVMVMYAGRVVEAGPTSAVCERLAHPYTRGLFGARPELGGPRGRRLATIPGRVPALHEHPPGCAFADRCERVVTACRTEVPPLREIGPGHAVRCIRPWPAPMRVPDSSNEAAKAAATP